MTMNGNGKSPSSQQNIVSKYTLFNNPTQWRYPDKPIRIPLVSLKEFNNLSKYFVQVKYNGWRCLIEFTPNRIVAYSRTNKIINLEKPTIDRLSNLNLPVGTVLDGELMKKSRTPGIEEEHYNLFDIIKFKNKWVGNIKYQHRLSMLNSILVLDKEPLITTYKFSTYNQIKTMFNAICNMTIEMNYVEGVVLKHMDSKLMGDKSSSIKNPKWFKVLCKQ